MTLVSTYIQDPQQVLLDEYLSTRMDITAVQVRAPYSANAPETTIYYTIGEIRRLKASGDEKFQHMKLHVQVMGRRYSQTELRTIREGLVQAIANNPDLEMQTALSAVVTPRNGMTVVYKHKPSGIYGAVTSSESIYNLYLSIASLLLKNDQDFVRRASHAVTKKEYMEFTPEEMEAIEAIRIKKDLEKTVNTFYERLVKQDYASDIDQANETLRSLERSLHDAMARLKDLEIRQYHAIHNLDNDSTLKELADYILQRKTIRVHSRDDYLLILNKSYIRIEPTSRDFFKPGAVDRPNHPLNRRALTRQLMLDIMEGNLLVPIYAIYILQKTNSGINIMGTMDKPTTWSRYMTNTDGIPNVHITRYDCFSGYRTMMKTAYKQQDYIGMLEVMEQCTGTINVFDGPVIPKIIEHIEQLGYNTPIKQRTDEGWKNIKLGEYYEEIKARTQPTGTTGTADIDTSHIG